MALPSSPPISFSQINVELGRAAGAQFQLGGTAERALAGKPTGPISISDFLGKSRLEASYIGVYNGGLTISGVSFGAAAAGRRIFAALSWARQIGSPISAISSATIGGTAATVHVIQPASDGTTSPGAAIISAPNTGSTSGSIVVNADGLVDQMYAAVFRVIGYSAINDSFKKTASFTLGANTISDALNMAAGGIAIVAGVGGVGFRLTDLSFSGVTRRYSVQYGNSRLASAMTAGLAAQSNRPISMSGTNDQSSSPLAFCGVSIR